MVTGHFDSVLVIWGKSVDYGRSLARETELPDWISEGGSERWMITLAAPMAWLRLICNGR